MGPIKKEQLQLHFDFGRHFNAADAASLRSCISRITPSILVLESAFIDESERKDAILDINRKVENARGDEAVKARLLRELFGSCGLFEWPDFGKAVLGLVLSEPGLRVHLVESSPSGEAIGDIFVLPFMLNAPGRAVRTLYDGDACKALSEAEDGFRAFNDFVVVRRNAQAVEGYRRLAAEIPELHPSIPCSGPIKILTRFGLAHAGMVRLLSEGGFEVGDVAMPAMDLSTELTIRYSADSKMAFSMEERRMILFDYALGMADGMTAVSQEEDAVRSRAIFAAIGEGEGFVTTALRIAGSSSSFEEFQARLGKFFENAPKNIYSPASL